MITSSPPHSTHLIPLALGRRRPAWIADFRDGWTFEPLRGRWPLPGQAALDRFLERQVATRADLVVGVTHPIADDLAARFGARSACVTNAFDPDLDASAQSASVPQLDEGKVNIVHAGKLYVEGSGRRDPAPLGPALRLLLERRPEASDRLRILVAGRVDAEEERYLSELDPANMIRHLGHLPHDSMLALQRRADALLLVTASGLVSLATGKLFEYLAADRPIIALGTGNEAARIVEETGTGVTVAMDDTEGLARAFEAALDGKLTDELLPARPRALPLSGHGGADGRAGRARDRRADGSGEVSADTGEPAATSCSSTTTWSGRAWVASASARPSSPGCCARTAR